MARQLALSLACEGLLRYKTASGRSSHTIEDYRACFKKLLLFLEDDPPVGSISRDQLVAFSAWNPRPSHAEPSAVGLGGTTGCSPLSSHTQLADSGHASPASPDIRGQGCHPRLIPPAPAAEGS